MNILEVKTASSIYNIYFEKDFDNLKNIFIEKKLNNNKVMIISDSNVSKLYLDEVADVLKDVSLELYTHVFDAGEANKNLKTVEEVYESLVHNHFDRNSIIVALGGGVTGDLAGFVASTYMRGIKFIQVPTTLLSQVDSSVGGKVGVDFLNHKNMIGAFYQPELVYTNINTLKTLEPRQFSSGMGEVIKHGLIMDKNYYNYIVDNKEKIKNLDYDCLLEIVKGSCAIKENVVSQDEKEKGIRAILNFGHTFGHAIETLSNFSVTHGEGVAMGSICSLYYSKSLNLLTEEEISNIKKLFDYFNLRNTLQNFVASDILKQMYLDKKTKNNVIEIIYLEKIGLAKQQKIENGESLLNYIEKILKD